MKCKLIDFKVSDTVCDEEGLKDEYANNRKNYFSCENPQQRLQTYETDKLYMFRMQLFGIDQEHKTYSIFVNDYRPYIFAKVPSLWDKSKCRLFIAFLNKQLQSKNASILKAEVVNYKKLYGFDGGEQHKFIQLYTRSNRELNALKYLWYTTGENRTLKPGGLKYKEDKIPLYEAHIPPLLRFFHERSINPSGWIEFSNDKISKTLHWDEKQSAFTYDKITNCNFEFSLSMYDINALQSDDFVPYKICSFDIEASSSHGDFPLPIKSYNKLTNEVVDYSNKHHVDKVTLKNILLHAFNIQNKNFTDISVVYPKHDVTLENI